MKKVSWKAIKLGWISAVVFCVSFIAGTYFIGFYGISLISLIGFMQLNKKKLRCPNCNERVKLEVLTKARKNEVHCKKCNALIEVDVNA
jgi:uncharacterized paraquat-inducible protein A